MPPPGEEDVVGSGDALLAGAETETVSRLVSASARRPARSELVPSRAGAAKVAGEAFLEADAERIVVTAASAAAAVGRRGWEADYFAAEARAARAAIPTDDAATHIAKLGLTRRQVARLLGCGIGTAQKLATPGERVGREIVERALREL